MKDNWTVFKLTFPDNKMYMGMTDLKLEDKCRNGLGFAKEVIFPAIIMKGWENIALNVIATNTTKEDADKRYRQGIMTNKTYDEVYGYNFKKGGKKVLCVTTKEVIPSISVAAKRYNVETGNINKCCNGKLKSAGKFYDKKLVWEWYESE